jgi:hypothetical protein
MHLAPAAHGRHEHEHEEDDHGEEGGDDGAAGSLAEAVELKADGHPVGTQVAPVRHVHDGSRRRAGPSQQQHHHQVAHHEEQPHAGSGGTEDANGGEGERQHKVTSSYRVRNHEEPAYVYMRVYIID